MKEETCELKHEDLYEQKNPELGMVWLVSIMPASERLRKEDHGERKRSLGYSLRACLRKKLSLLVLYCYCDKILDKGSLRKEGFQSIELI